MADGQNNIIETVRALGLPSDKYAVFGSGLMDVLGLRSSNDIDIVVTRDLFRELYADDEWCEMKYPDDCFGLNHVSKNIELFYESKMPLCSQVEIEEKIRRATTITGVKFVQVSDVLAWKRALRREKDLQDVALIDYYLQNNSILTENYGKGSSK